MRDIKNARLIYIKAALFLVIGVTAAALLYQKSPGAATFLLLCLTIWAFCRLYYFTFYVIENYVDADFKFAGVGSFLRYVFGKGRRSTPSPCGDEDRGR